MQNYWGVGGRVVGGRASLRVEEEFLSSRLKLCVLGRVPGGEVCFKRGGFRGGECGSGDGG
jgi:hypothetical protein